MSHIQTVITILAMLTTTWVVTEIVVKVELWRAEQRRKRILGRFQ